MKRCIDLLSSILLIIILSPLFLVVSILVFVKLGSPIIFKQIRPGYNEKPFYLYKFRSMSDLKDDNGCLLPDEMRMTPFGQWIRKYSIDELPQLINVIKGDISLVGPRPLLLEYLPLYSNEQAKRHLVRPGITGWAQVNGRNALSWEERFKLDIWYVENHSLFLDLKILFLTIMKVIKKDGISFEGHVTMHNFTGTRTTRFMILSAEEEWKQALTQFKHLDIFYSPKYAQIFAKVEKGEAKAAFYEEDGTRILYPYILREIPYFDRQYKDIATPYGYGGPYIEGNDEVMPRFYSLFSDYCSKNNIVTEIVRLHPIVNNKEYVETVMDIRYIRRTVVINLENPYKEIWNSFSKNNQRNIKQARKFGLSAEIGSKTSENIEQFHYLYGLTMNKRKADKMYYFHKDFFAELLSKDSLYESFLLFVQYQNQVIAGVILLIGQEFAHYQFGASHPDYLHLKPNNLLFEFMIQCSQEKGAKLLHLGGGYQEDDGLFRFKSSFSNSPYYSYYLGCRIFNKGIYDQLNEMASKYESYHPDFFPAYRSALQKVESNSH